MTTPTHPIKAPKKLIEVALPLDLINTEAARIKRKAPKGYPTTLHTWWAHRPLPVARAIIFAQLVNDPSWKWEMDHPGEPVPGHLKGGYSNARRHLFKVLQDLVLWENTTNEVVLDKARTEIRKSWRETCEVNKDHPQAAELFDPDKLPGLHDPFAGGGAIPLEAQRLGLEVYASDLNPVAVLINKAMIEIPPKFAERAPVSSLMGWADQAANIISQGELTLEATSKKGRGKNKAEAAPTASTKAWPGATGLAEDVRYYGAWMRAEAERRIGHLYRPIEVTAAMAKERPELTPYVGERLTVIAWLWARTVRSPNPAFSHVDVPLAATFVLSSKEGKESWVKPVVEGDSYRFTIRTGTPSEDANEGTKAKGRGANFRCILSDAPMSGDYIKAEGQAGRMGARMMAVVAEGRRGRVYLAPTPEMESIAKSAKPDWRPGGEVPARLTGGTCVPYGLREWGDLFTPRQLVALTTFSDLVSEARDKVRHDSRAVGLPDDPRGLDAGGTGATAYAEAISVYLTFALDRAVDYGSSICTWRPKDNAMRATMSRQAIPMTWDFAEGSPFAKSSSGFLGCTAVVASAIDLLPARPAGRAFQLAAQALNTTSHRVISTDPPYYDNIAYADLSDFFYVWMRGALRSAFGALLATIQVPKAEELVAAPYRHGGVDAAERFFLSGMTDAMRALSSANHPSAPITIYYAFKESETTSDTGTTSPGWETFLEAVLRAGLSVSGTWPVRTEGDNRQVGTGNNALASSIVLVCRPRPFDAPTVLRRAFLRELNQALPLALSAMTEGTDEYGKKQSPVAPVDLSQAIIGPGMAVFSKYSAVLESNGTPMRVKAALELINRFLGEDDFDHDSQFCLHWFDQFGWGEGAFGEADVLARAKATSVSGLTQAGVIAAGAGKVRLLKPTEYPADWDAASDARLPVWEVLHQLIRAFRQDGEMGAGRILAAEAVKPKIDAARQLAYRLYTLCERRGMADEARAYNEIGTSWDALESASTMLAPTPKPRQQNLL